MGYTSIKVKRTSINQHTWKETGFEGLGLSWLRIQNFFAYNLKRKKQEKLIKSQLRNYKKREQKKKNLKDLSIKYLKSLK